MASKMRLIDANEALINTYNEIYWTESEAAAVRSFLVRQKTVDAAPVVHGRWLVDDYDSGELEDYAAYIEVHCSECGYGLGAESGQYGWGNGDPFPLHFCPNCGAKMDGERKSDT